jgi:hypothetical protein
LYLPAPSADGKPFAWAIRILATQTPIASDLGGRCNASGKPHE